MRRPRAEICALAALGVCAAGFFWGHEAAQHVTPQLGLASLVVALLCLYGRLALAGTAWFAVAIVFLLPVLPDYLPRTHDPSPGCRLTIVTFNQLEEHPDATGAAKLIAGLHPDLIFAQKVYDTAGFSAALAANGFAGFHRFLSSYGNQEVIASRYPILGTKDDRNGTWIDVLISGQAVRLFGLSAPRAVGVHGSSPLQRGYYAQLDADLAARDGPFILAGDGNTSVFSAEMKSVEAEVGDAWKEAGYGLGATFPGPWRRMGFFGPFVRIDYILHSKAFAAISAERLTDAIGAGHYPVVAELSFIAHGDSGAPCQ